MDAFVARKRPASAIEITDKNLPILPFSLHEPSSPPAMKTKIALRPTSNGSEKAPRRRRLLLGKSPAGAGSLLVEQEGLGDGIKECLALEKYEVRRMSFRMRTCKFHEGNMDTNCSVCLADGYGRSILHIFGDKASRFNQPNTTRIPKSWWWQSSGTKMLASYSESRKSRTGIDLPQLI
ncbi:hypothetical protein BDZ45DRAFT_687942 [Acephala macrosclerotiorum]|nr:hypothetical protein BDZ45DRAFT_687942 [Acephala macrosclerotiorum]